MSKAKKEEGVEVLLSCVYAGDGWAANPGDVVKVDADEAERLIGLGVAVVAEKAAAEAASEASTA